MTCCGKKSKENKDDADKTGRLSVGAGRRPPASKGLQRKIVLLGNASVGKSSIALRYSKGEFSKETSVTLGGAFFAKDVTLKNGDAMQLNIWDTGGSERARPMVPLYYRGSQAGLICFDLTNESTFGESIDYWSNELNEALEPDTFQLFLVGNKADLVEERKISKEMAESVASKMGVRYFETSSKTGQGVTEMF